MIISEIPPSEGAMMQEDPEVLGVRRRARISLFLKMWQKARFAVEAKHPKEFSDNDLLKEIWRELKGEQDPHMWIAYAKAIGAQTNILPLTEQDVNGDLFLDKVGQLPDAEGRQREALWFLNNVVFARLSAFARATRLAFAASELCETPKAHIDTVLGILGLHVAAEIKNAVYEHIKTFVGASADVGLRLYAAKKVEANVTLASEQRMSAKKWVEDLLRSGKATGSREEKIEALMWAHSVAFIGDEKEWIEHLFVATKDSEIDAVMRIRGLKEVASSRHSTMPQRQEAMSQIRGAIDPEKHDPAFILETAKWLYERTFPDKRESLLSTCVRWFSCLAPREKKEGLVWVVEQTVLDYEDVNKEARQMLSRSMASNAPALG